MSKQYSVGLLGVRGYVGEELVSLIDSHPNLYLNWVSSRALEGKKLGDIYPLDSDIAISNIGTNMINEYPVDIIILALPNGAAKTFVDALRNKTSAKVVIDLSADYRFDSQFQYLVPELHKLRKPNLDLGLDSKKSNKTIWISNPGCYATAMQIALAPIIDLIEGRPACFGISGYSGAGTSPLPTNQTENLISNIIPYKLVHHLHEKEVSFHLDKKVSFSPHVAEFFRGISMTVQVALSNNVTQEELYNRVNDYYAYQPLVQCTQKIPLIKQVVNTNACLVGGIEVSKDGKRATIVSVLDNLLKGAASQAIQNINTALDLLPDTGLSSKLSDFDLYIPSAISA